MWICHSLLRPNNFVDMFWCWVDFYQIANFNPKMPLFFKFFFVGVTFLMLIYHICVVLLLLLLCMYSYSFSLYHWNEKNNRTFYFNSSLSLFLLFPHWLFRTTTLFLFLFSSLLFPLHINFQLPFKVFLLNNNDSVRFLVYRRTCFCSFCVVVLISIPVLFGIKEKQFSSKTLTLAEPY